MKSELQAIAARVQFLEVMNKETDAKMLTSRLRTMKNWMIPGIKSLLMRKQ